jgi:ankyrin repeat protein
MADASILYNHNTGDEDSVWVLQRLLIDIYGPKFQGKNIGGSDGEPDGKFGATTKSALQDLQGRIDTFIVAAAKGENLTSFWKEGAYNKALLAGRSSQALLSDDGEFYDIFRGDTALTAAARHGQTATVKGLLDAGANPDPTANGRTALILAAKKGHLDVVEKLLAEGANPDLPTNNGWTALMWAAEKGHLDVVEKLLAEGADPDLQDDNGWTALMCAAGSGHADVVEKLLAEGADPDLQDDNGWTALMCAAGSGHADVVEKLLAEGADPDLPDNNGWTALIEAAGGGHADVVEKLLAKGANQNLKTGEQQSYMVVPGLDGVVTIPPESTAAAIATIARDALAAAEKDTTAHKEIMTALSTSEPAAKSEAAAAPAASPPSAGPDQDTIDAFILAAAKGGDLSSFWGEDAYNKALLAGRSSQDLLSDDGEFYDIFRGDTALIAAARHGQTATVTGLLDAGAKPDLQGNNGRTALIEAAGGGHADVVEKLLDKEADPDLPDNYGRTALIKAAGKGHADVVEKLLAKGAKPDLQDDNGWTALIWGGGHLDVVEKLLAEGANLNLPSHNGWTALIRAAGGGHADVVEKLLAEGADQNLKTGEKQSYMVVPGLDGYITIPPKSTALDIATIARDALGKDATAHKEIMTALSTSEPAAKSEAAAAPAASPPSAGPDQDTIDAFILAAAKGENLTSFWKEGAYNKALLAGRISKNDAGSSYLLLKGNTALIAAARHGQTATVTGLLDAGAKPDLQDDDGRTALMWAAREGHLDVVEKLLDKEADPDLQDNYGRTALIKAANKGHLDVVAKLLAKEADPDLQDDNGWTALMWAAESGHADVVEKLLAEGADPDLQDDNGWTALMWAANKGHLDVVAKLLAKEADPDLQDDNGWTALMWAAGSGHADVVEKLLAEGANQNIKTSNKTYISVPGLDDLVTIPPESTALDIATNALTKEEKDTKEIMTALSTSEPAAESEAAAAPAATRALPAPAATVKAAAPAAKPASPPAARAAARPTPDPTVRDVQKALKGLRHRPGPLDGIDGPKTRAAVNAFRTRAGAEPLAPDAPIDRSVLDHIRANAAKGRVPAPLVSAPTSQPRPLRVSSDHGRPPLPTELSGNRLSSTLRRAVRGRPPQTDSRHISPFLRNDSNDPHMASPGSPPRYSVSELQLPKIFRQEAAAPPRVSSDHGRPPLPTELSGNRLSSTLRRAVRGRPPQTDSRHISPFLRNDSNDPHMASPGSPPRYSVSELQLPKIFRQEAAAPPPEEERLTPTQRAQQTFLGHHF